MTSAWTVGPDGVITPPPLSAPSLHTAADAVPDAATGRALVVAGPRQDAVFLATSGGIVVREAEDLDSLKERAREFAKASQAGATRKGYASDWRHFEAWCAAHGLAALPALPGTVAAYLTDLSATHAVSTLTRRISSIVTAHRLAGYALDMQAPDVRDTWRGIRRTKGTAPRRVAALTRPLLLRVLATCGDRTSDLRDRALLLVGFMGAFRRSELCALDLADVTISAEGLTIRLTRSKGDQEGEGATVAIGRTGSDTCPVAAFEAWIAAAGITEGRAFRSVDRHGNVRAKLSDRAVALIVQARARAAGLPDADHFAGHSMRAGFCTAAAAKGIEEREIMRQSRHKSVTVMRRYIREGGRWERNLAVELGL